MCICPLVVNEGSNDLEHGGLISLKGIQDGAFGQHNTDLSCIIFPRHTLNYTYPQSDKR